MKQITDTLSSLVLKAGEIMLKAHDIESGDHMSEKAGDAANLVTVYDVAVQNFLITEITKAIPEAYFIAEEKENDADVLNRKYCFVIDPIDGTANFTHDYKHSCISLALFSYGEVVFAAVYDPYQKELFTARKGEGAFVNGRPIHTANRDTAHSIVSFGTSPYYKDTLGEKSFRLCYKLFRTCSDIRRCGAAALDLAYLAAGRNDVFFEALLSPWDIAAGYLLITEAGGIMTDMNGNKIDFSAPSPVFAATPAVYDELIGIVKEIMQ
ncbi:MAG: inositol monophosphatase [Clostridia bacterium]|nr:inositol monophosphatase [Clostridia bacterium]